MSNIKVLAIMGATASGKSALAYRLAREWNGEIISADSAQVYREVDIGTAKPTLAERVAVRHHLIDIRDLGQSFSLADFQRLATQAVLDITARNKLPIIVGGTGLYVRGLLEGYTLAAPAPDPLLREQLAARELDDLLQELRQRDPETYESIDRCNKRRVSRALEVVLQTGRSFQECAHRCPPDWQVLKLAIRPPREIVRARIVARLQAMLEAGWVQEVRELLGLGRERVLLQANILGYERVVAHLRGEISFETMVADIATQTCRFAKRQSTWLRAEPNLVSFESGIERYEEISEVVSNFWNSTSEV